jgi:site-specific DNA-adenine methylase
MRYPGGKNSPGVYQHIINRIPPHETYIELFGGSLAIYRHKKRSSNSILIDADPSTVESWPWRSQTLKSVHNLELAVVAINGDAISFVRKHHRHWRESTVVYADPPYPLSVRRQQRSIYRCELLADNQHRSLLAMLNDTAARVLISGYDCELYERYLAGWTKSQYRVMVRGGYQVTETLWCNFPPPAVLHDTRYIGSTYRDRERIKRMADRWHRRFERLDPHVQQLLLSRLKPLHDNRI